MINYNLSDDDLVRGRDIREIIEEVNSNEIVSDNSTISVTKNEGGTSVSVIDQYGGGGSKGGTVIETKPFKISLSYDSVEDINYAEITSGIVYTDAQNFIPAGYVDLTDYNIGETVYIYLKVANNWVGGSGDLLNYPELTVLTNEGSTNFYGNNTVFPKSDIGNFYYQVGTIDIEDDGNSNPSYTITQIADDNASIQGLTFKGFTLAKFYKAKTSDAQADTSYTLYCTTGQAQTPETTETIPTSSKSVSVNGTQQVYLNIPSIKDPNSGGYINFSASIKYINNPSASDTNIYYLIGSLSSGGLTQSQDGNFLSPSRIW